MDMVYYVVLFGLIFARISGLFILMPVFSGRNVPAQLKVGIIFFIAVAIMPLLTLSTSLAIESLVEFSYHVIIEFIIGLTFGFVIVLYLSSIYLAGAVVDRNMGFSMVNVINPMDNSSMPVSANIYYIFAMMIFLFTDGHHIMIQGIVKSMESVPLGLGVINPLIYMDFTQLLSDAFVIGVRLAAPFIITTLVANMILGMLSKAMPGMNVFMIGMPFKIFVGLTLFSLIMPRYYGSMIEIYRLSYTYMYDLIANYL